jgi:hypothetical protein
MANRKITVVAYCLAAGFIRAVAFSSTSKMSVAASVPALTPISDLK